MTKYSIQIKLIADQTLFKPRYFITYIKGALTVPQHSSGVKGLRSGPGEWLSEADAQYLIDHSDVYEVLVTSSTKS